MCGAFERKEIIYFLRIEKNNIYTHDTAIRMVKFIF